MSYIVKSRDFPKSCNECDERHLCFDFYYCGVGYQKDGRHLDVEEHCYYKTKHPDCPLIELPQTHGRLIDADRLKEMIEQYHCNGCDNYNGARCSACWVDDCFTYIDDTPTIIEAEHESEAQRWARVGRDISKGLQEGIEAIDSEGIEE